MEKSRHISKEFLATWQARKRLKKLLMKGCRLPQSIQPQMIPRRPWRKALGRSAGRPQKAFCSLAWRNWSLEAFRTSGASTCSCLSASEISSDLGNRGPESLFGPSWRCETPRGRGFMKLMLSPQPTQCPKTLRSSTCS